MSEAYICIDMKSFFASCECVERGLDPMKAKLVVADASRSPNTICLAVSPALKALGVKSRCRFRELPKNVDFIVAVPRMRTYLEYSQRVFKSCLKFISADDMHVYSVDEAFFDVTHYLSMYKMTAAELADRMRDEIKRDTGIPASCGVGSNLYLAKIALDITAKHSPRFLGELTEESYRETLWDHEPLTDFWMIGQGTASRLAKYGITTMRGIATASEKALTRWFGVDSELLFDHAWGRESARISDIKSYEVKSHSLSSGQVLMRDYSFDEALLVVSEMTDSLALDMVFRGVVSNTLTLCVSYSRDVIAPARSSFRFDRATNDDRDMIPAIKELYRRIVRSDLPIRRLNICASNLQKEDSCFQIGLFDLPERRASTQRAVLDIRRRYGKNSIFRASSLLPAATALERNRQIGGHKA